MPGALKICPYCKNVMPSGNARCIFCNPQGDEEATLDKQPVSYEDSETAKIKRLNTLIKGTMLADRFTIEAMIGSGGMADVYRVRDRILDEIIALKVLKPLYSSDKKMLNRFKREIKLARSIRHPNICTIYDFGISGDLFFTSMEYIEGKTLARLIAEKRITQAQIVPMMLGILEGLAFAHSRTIIHRDLKPSNIMIDPDFQPHIMDFGLARQLSSQKGRLTMTGQFMGTPLFMSPEQLRGGVIDQRSDIYSFGIIFYQVATSQVPFDGDNPVSIAVKHLQESPVPPRSLNAEIPEELERIILTCLEKDPEKRFQTVMEIQNAITAFIEGKHLVPSKRTTILIVDDDEEIRQLIILLLRKTDCRFIEAKNGEEAIRLCVKHHPDLILLDYSMPVMDGYQVAEYLRHNNDLSSIPIIMISSITDKQYKSYSKTLGVKHFISKPFDAEELLPLVKHYLPATTA